MKCERRTTNDEYQRRTTRTNERPTTNHCEVNDRFSTAHPTVSSELLGASARVTRSPRATWPSCSAATVRFADGSVEPVDAIIYATGYNVSFPFFDPDFLSAPDNVLPLYKRMLKPGVDDLAFIGLGQPIPTIFPFAELQSKLAARWLSGDWAPPDRADGAEIVARRGVPHGPLHRTSRATRCSSSGTATSTSWTRARSQPVRRAPARAHPRDLPRPDAGLRSRRQSRSDNDLGADEVRGEALAAEHLNLPHVRARADVQRLAERGELIAVLGRAPAR